MYIYFLYVNSETNKICLSYFRKKDVLYRSEKQYSPIFVSLDCSICSKFSVFTSARAE